MIILEVTDALVFFVCKDVEGNEYSVNYVLDDVTVLKETNRNGLSDVTLKGHLKLESIPSKLTKGSAKEEM